MGRIARVVAPGYPHHIVQRGSRSQRVFFSNADRRFYLRLLKKCAAKTGVEFWAYCLMDNHVHLVAIPKNEESLALCFGETHRKYALAINTRNEWKGHLWQSRFNSYPLEGRYLYATMRYVERNPVRAGIVEKAEDYLWSSARAHVFKAGDALLSGSFLDSEITDWGSFLTEDDENNKQLLRKHARTCRPMGSEAFLIELEDKTGRALRKRKPGPKLE
ncbi:MAG: transposase [Candidatus Omnitrophica bacterium]|nr:transposase [Candidatus Omnitrophota bacterium]MDD5546141.1 transposase [Candidatus Omnitrophota bacterium]